MEVGQLLTDREDIIWGIRWNVGDGHKVRFWTDWWVGSKPLVSDIVGTAPSDINSKLVQLDLFLIE